MKTELSKISTAASNTVVLTALLRTYEKKGFNNCANVQKIKAQLARMQYDKYKDKYPDCLYFTNEQFYEIVKRNNLTVSTAEAYTGDIPDHCWRVIEQENIDSEDIREDIADVEIISSITLCKINCYGISYQRAMLLKNGSKEYIEKYVLPPNTFHGRKLSKEEVDELFYGKNYAKYPWTYSHIKDECIFNIKISKQTDYSNLYIAAPADKIDKSKEKKPNFFEKFKIVRQEQPKDPIVFRYVKDGILVITFWE